VGERLRAGSQALLDKQKTDRSRVATKRRWGSMRSELAVGRSRTD